MNKLSLLFIAISSMALALPPVHPALPPVAPTNGFDQTLKELDADFLSITNYVYTEWRGAHDAALRMRDKIMSLPPEVGKEYAQKMLDRIVSIPIDHLGHYERIHALDAIQYMGGVVSWQGARRADFCDTFIRLLTKCRDSIEYARQEGDREFIITASNNLNGRSQFYEKELAYRTSSKVSPQDYVRLVAEMSDEEYAVVKAKFEKFRISARWRLFSLFQGMGRRAKVPSLQTKKRCERTEIYYNVSTELPTMKRIQSTGTNRAS